MNHLLLSSSECEYVSMKRLDGFPSKDFSCSIQELQSAFREGFRDDHSFSLHHFFFANKYNFLTASKKFNYDRTIIAVPRWKGVGDINVVHLQRRV